MVSITDVRASNESLKSQPPGLVAVLAGATAGIGLHALKQLSKHATAPRVYMIGRSRAKAATLLDELKVINPEGTYVFIKANSPSSTMWTVSVKRSRKPKNESISSA
jgi:hypothetical protein